MNSERNGRRTRDRDALRPYENWFADLPVVITAVMFVAITCDARAQVSQTSAAEFTSSWAGTRVWVGPEYWANPLQHWRVNDGEVIGTAGANRTLHLLTHQLIGRSDGFETEVTVRLANRPGKAGLLRTWGGFQFGIRGALDNYRNALVHPTSGVEAGVRGDGRLICGEAVSEETISLDQPVRLTLVVSSQGDRWQATLSAKSTGEDETTIQLRTTLVEEITGNIALTSSASGRTVNADWGFRDWNVIGSSLEEHPEQTFGPILWSQYTLSRQIVKLTALFPPIGSDDEHTARLEIQQANGEWREIAEAPIDTLSRTATFRVTNWDDSSDVNYRVRYKWSGDDHFWSGTIRRDPHDADKLKIAVFSCDHGEVFPNRRISQNVLIQNPDIVFFAGDQIYESHGGFGVARTAETKEAMLDYLRKYWQFGWSWRDVLKDRPSVIIPDDHDVFQGNIWGHGGRALPESSDGKGFEQGGFLMPVAWVNAIQRTQVAHLPDPIDPEPCESGIEVYFTEMRYGGVSLAIIEDRKFKSGPGSILPEDLQRGRRGRDPVKLDVVGAELLGKRQEAFLKRWATPSRDADLRLVCSQTIFCKASTHTGRELNRSVIDLDCNGWPQSGRRRALEAIQPAKAIMLHGDQHLGSLIVHGLDEWEDAATAFMVPGTSNGFPRAWWPDEVGENHVPGSPDWTGRYFDGLGNRITVLAAANPEKGSNVLRVRPDLSPEDIAHHKGSGHGVVIVDRAQGTVTFEMWRLHFDAENPNSEDQFIGFPQTLPLSQFQ